MFDKFYLVKNVYSITDVVIKSESVEFSHSDSLRK